MGGGACSPPGGGGVIGAGRTSGCGDDGAWKPPCGGGGAWVYGTPGGGGTCGAEDDICTVGGTSRGAGVSAGGGLSTTREHVGQT